MRREKSRNKEEAGVDPEHNKYKYLVIFRQKYLLKKSFFDAIVKRVQTFYIREGGMGTCIKRPGGLFNGAPNSSKEGRLHIYIKKLKWPILKFILLLTPKKNETDEDKKIKLFNYLLLLNCLIERKLNGKNQNQKERCNMRPELKLKALTIVLLSIFILNSAPLCGADVKLVEKIEFSPGEDPPPKPWTFSVTEDQLFIIPNSEAGGIEIYEMNGTSLKLVKAFGKTGVGEERLIEPTYCFYCREEGKFGVFDFKKRKVFIYDRIGKLEFKFVKAVYCRRAVTDFQLKGDRLLIAGYKPDTYRNPYDLYYINIADGKTTFLLPSYRKYGLKSPEEYEKKRNTDELQATGIASWFDIQNNNVYVAWESKLSIIKLNLDSGDLTTFGQKTSNYFEPKAEQFLKAHRKRDIQKIQSERSNRSYVKNVLASSTYVLVVIEGPVDQEKQQLKLFVQFYDLQGKFIKEVPIAAQPELTKMWLDKDRNILYSISSQSRTGANYFFLKFQISD